MLFIGERERWPVLLASLFALAGVVIMVGRGAAAARSKTSNRELDVLDLLKKFA